MKNQLPKVLELGPRHVAFVSYTGNYMGNPDIFAGLFDKLCAWAGPKELITPTTVFLSSYQDNPKTTPPDQLTLDLCMGIYEDIDTDGDIQMKTLPGGEYAIMHSELTGPEEYGAAWNEIVEWVEKSNYEIDMSRPSYEIYFNNPKEHPEKHHILDICMSVKAK